MALKGNLDIDPRGLIFEAYRIDGLDIKQARSIFLDWALERAGDDMRPQLELLLETYGNGFKNHPMTAVLKEGLSQAQSPKRRGGRAGRFTTS